MLHSAYDVLHTISQASTVKHLKSSTSTVILHMAYIKQLQSLLLKITFCHITYLVVGDPVEDSGERVAMKLGKGELGLVRNSKT